MENQCIEKFKSKGIKVISISNVYYFNRIVLLEIV